MSQCRQCQSSFEIRQQDREFYKKFDAPDPKLCPPCREQRRLSFRNETSLYKDKCGGCGKGVVTSYSPEMKFKSMCSDCFHADKIDPMQYGQDFDFNRPFLEQIEELRDKVPRLSMLTINCENSDYTSYTADCKNCYLISAGEKSEDCFYSRLCQNNNNIIDSDYIWDSELCYECINVSKCYHCFNSFQLENCNDCHFCFDLRGCKNCLFSYNLRNKQYYIFNKQHSKEEYETKLKELNLGSRDAFRKAYEIWVEMMKKNAIHKGINITNCENSTGDNLKDDKNMHMCFDMQNSQDCAFCAEGDAISTYDANNLYYNPELNLDILSNLASNRISFSMFTFYCNDMQYCDLIYNSNDLFGCVGLKRKKFCILNKQYTEEEYRSMRDRIIEHMKKTGEWGEFFPNTMSHYGYNESLAYEYYPLERSEVEANGWKWRDRDSKMSEVEKTVNATELPDKIDDVDDEILNWAIKSAKSEDLFKIIPQELEFYKRFGLPLPQLTPFERHMERQLLRNPRHIFDRKCDNCHADIKSSYAADRSEKVYCEKCYLTEVY
ncbi:hypothetical protein ACFLZH_03435 [Patescibacteria group bacterium]